MNRWLVLLILLAMVAPFEARSQAGASDVAHSDVAKLAAAAAEHPEDPDLAVAWGSALASAGRPSEAGDVFAQVDASWPGRRPGLPLQIVQLLYTVGRNEEALARVEALLLLEPDSGAAHLYRALLLRRVDRGPEADAELERAAELAPALRPETLLLRGLARIERGDERGAEPLLQEAVALDPMSEAARRSRLLLPQRIPVVEGPLVSLGAYGGYLYDSNVTLDSGLDFGGISSQQEDTGGVFGANIALRPLRGETLGLVLGYAYDGSLYQNLSAYDFQSHLGFASIYVRASERVTFRLDGLLIRGLLDGEPYFHSNALRPNVFVNFGETLGITRFFAAFEERRFLEDSFLTSLNRNGWLYVAGLDHSFLLPFAPFVLTTLHAGYLHQDTRATTDFLGFEGAYDYDRGEVGVSVRMPLFWRISAGMSVGLGYERYPNENVIDFLTDDGVGNAAPRARTDFVVDGGISLVRPIIRGISIELAWRATNRASNVDLYAYPRQVVGLYVRFQTD